jgi:hypothetical protein
MRHWRENSMRRDFRVLLVLALVLLIGGTVMAASGDIWALRNSAGSEVLRVLSTGALVPGSDNTYDLGSSALSWKDAHIQGAATLGSASVTGAATVGTTLGVTGATTCNGDVNLGNAATDSVTMAGRVYATDKLDVTGATALASTLAVTGASTFTGATTHNGDVTLGNALADSIDVNGTADLASVRFSGYINGTIKDTPADYTVIAGTDHFVTVSNTDSARTVYLPTAASVGTGGIIVVKDKSGAANSNNITVEGAGDETIDGAANNAIATAYGSLRLITDGSNWFTF